MNDKIRNSHDPLFSFPGEWEIPENTDIMFSIYSYHHDPKHWPDPAKYQPERWLDHVGNEGHELTKRLVIRPRHYMPFGAGIRICPGETVARANVFLIFAAIVQRYELRFPPGIAPYADACASKTFISTAMVQDYQIIAVRRPARQ